jgi:hypothetical protein
LLGNNDPIIRYRKVSRPGTQNFEITGPKWEKFGNEFKEEKIDYLKKIESNIAVLGIILGIIGTILILYIWIF